MVLLEQVKAQWLNWLLKNLEYIYIDTGAMYRALTWQALQDNIDIHEEADLVACLNSCPFHL